MQSSAGSADFFRGVPRKQQRIYIFLCVFQTVLPQHPCAARQAHRGKTVILRNRDITRMQAIDQRKIHAVRSFGYDDGLCTRAPNLVRGVAQNDARNMMRVCQMNRLIYDRTAIRINKNYHASGSSRHTA